MRALLLCPPDYYGIEYEINPWMSRARGAETALAQEQWRGLHATLSKLDCKIELVLPQPKLPDMVFTANAGLAVGKQLFRAIFGTKSAPAKRRILPTGWKNAASKFPGCPMISISKAKATRS